MALATNSHSTKARVVAAAALLLLPMAASLPEFFKFGISEGDSTFVKAEDAAVIITLKYAPFMMFGKSYLKLVVSQCLEAISLIVEDSYKVAIIGYNVIIKQGIDPLVKNL